ncbi:hypothetical protein [Tenacibaculum agarivorans]|uniref:hypothetical protein n=1 Tax=Tenacibaculum agarivorans TaxID=1908389 RepID=UPI00094BBB47|nr:hypothetical protein [Tenacibaculum agarivorans]
MDREIIIKKIVVEAFEGAKERCLSNNKTAWAKHIATEVDVGVSEKTLKRAYNKYVLDKVEEVAPKEETILCFCRYLGFNSYEEYVEASKIEILMKSMTYERLLNYAPIKKHEFIEKLSKISRFKNEAIYYWLGVLFLETTQYELAISNLKKSIKLNPTKGEYYYNLVLAKINGRRPFVLTSNEIEEILKDIEIGLQYNSEITGFNYLKYIIQEDFYKNRGLGVKGEEIKLEEYERETNEYKRLLRMLQL